MVFSYRRLKHSTVRPFECNICNKKFALRTLLNQHIRFQHCNERPVSCTICGKGFRTKSQLQKHSYSHRENTIDCEACEHKSWTMEGYKIHLVATHPELAVEKKIHHYTCQYCSRRFAVLHQYKRHLAIHTGKQGGNKRVLMIRGGRGSDSIAAPNLVYGVYVYII